MKKNKTILFIIIIIFSFFFLSNDVYAVTIKGYWNTPSSVSNESFVMKGKTRKLNDFGVFVIGNDHAYCIEPGARMNYIGYENNNRTSTLSGYDKLTATQRKLISYVLTFAYKDSSPSTYSLSKYTNIVAAQGLIWEIVTGERTNFNTLAPNKNSAKNSFYYVTHNSSNANVKKIAQEYNRIYYAIRSAFINATGQTGKVFTFQAQAENTVMVWKEDLKKYTLTINDSDFKYWTAQATQNGISVKMNSNSVTITSDTAIDEKDAKLITISTVSKNGTNPIVYTDSYYQDIVNIKGTSISKYIKVYTPKFQMKIIKKASLDSKPLSGVKFNICTAKTCSKSSVIATVTTNADGEAIYDNVSKPGTYYVQEISTVKGYELDSKVYPVTVTKSNISNSKSFGTITLKNTNKSFNLIKYTVDENEKPVILDDGCGTDTYTGPEFEIKENGNKLYFKERKPGEYDVASSQTENATTSLKTCNGKFKVYTLPNCNYTISEIKAPEGLTLPANPTKNVNICGSDKSVAFTNGFTGLEFQKKDEEGNFITGGKFALQMKVNNIYKEILLKENQEGYYEYSSDLTEEKDGASYTFVTATNEYDKGKAFIKNLPPGEYRIVEKEAPEGYNLIEDKDSTALVTIKDSSNDDYYLVELVNRKSNKSGSESSAELIVTITTGRKVPNYVFIISGLLILLIITVILRRKVRK